MDSLERKFPIRNERVNGSNPLSGSPFSRANKLFHTWLLRIYRKMTLELLEGFGSSKFGSRCQNVLSSF